MQSQEFFYLVNSVQPVLKAKQNYSHMKNHISIKLEGK